MFCPRFGLRTLDLMANHPPAVHAGHQAIQSQALTFKHGMRGDGHLASPFEAVQQRAFCRDGNAGRTMFKAAQ